MGGIAFTTKTDLIRNCKCYGLEAVALVDSQYDLVELQLDPNLIQVGSILVPSYDAINEYMDGNIQGFEMAYVNQLSYRDCDEFISLLIYAMFQNKNILLYVGEEQTLVPYIDSLANYIRANFGIIIGVDNDFGSVDPTYYATWISKFYTYGFIDADQFMHQYPVNTNIMPEALNKLVTELPPADFLKAKVYSSMDECNKYYMQEIIQAHGALTQMYAKVE